MQQIGQGKGSTSLNQPGTVLHHLKISVLQVSCYYGKGEAEQNGTI
jgi:hypothetical protein